MALRQKQECKAVEVNLLVVPEFALSHKARRETITLVEKGAQLGLRPFLAPQDWRCPRPHDSVSLVAATMMAARSASNVRGTANNAGFNVGLA